MLETGLHNGAQQKMTKGSITIGLGKRIRQRRMQLGLSQERLGEVAGLHRTYIGAVERGEKNLTVVTLCRIANALKRPAAFFLE
jgi:transcriptional regulator with XRE-family HTH domain